MKLIQESQELWRLFLIFGSNFYHLSLQELNAKKTEVTPLDVDNREKVKNSSPKKLSSDGDVIKLVKFLSVGLLLVNCLLTVGILPADSWPTVY